MPEIGGHSASHRSWPAPERPWAGHLTWRDLLFAHWPVPAAALRPHVPAALDIDEFDGTAWLAVAPFEMTDMHLRGLPSVPGLSRTLELNVRTYVRAGAAPGVWFFSLDAESRAAVLGARWLYHLNYLHARMGIRRDGERVRYGSRRIHRGAPEAEFRGSYGPVGKPFLSQPGSIEHWLTERYALFSVSRRGHLYRGDIHHVQWQLQPAEAGFEVNTMTRQLGLELPRARPLLHFSKSLEVLVWSLDRLS